MLSRYNSALPNGGGQCDDVRAAQIIAQLPSTDVGWRKLFLPRARERSTYVCWLLARCCRANYATPFVLRYC